MLLCLKTETEPASKTSCFSLKLEMDKVPQKPEGRSSPKNEE